MVVEEVNGIEFEKLDELIYTISPTYIAVFQPCSKSTLNKIKKYYAQELEQLSGLKIIHAHYIYIEDLYMGGVKRLLARYYLIKEKTNETSNKD